MFEPNAPPPPGGARPEPPAQPVSLRQVLAPLGLKSLLVGPPHPHLWALWLMATPLLMGVALLFDFFPREGPPAFPTSGLTGDAAVFNFGWPVVTSLYAPNVGFRLGPLGGAVFATQFLLYIAGTGLVWVRNRAGGSP